MVNYANSKVYKIWSTQGDKIYIGSTTKPYLCQRMDKHRSDYKRFKDGKETMVEIAYIRGGHIRLVVLPEMLSKAPFFDRIKMWRKYKGHAVLGK